MFQAIFNSLSGMFSFSRSLNTVSNNVTNMNTPGFRGSDSFFSNIGGGRGTQIAGEGLRSRNGDIRETRNETHLAIDGSGYFVLADEAGNTYYTRAGEFRFDDDGILVDTVSGHRVMAFGGNGALTVVDRDEYRLLPAQPTTRINVVGNLPRPQDSTSAPATTPVNSIVVYDATGATHNLTISFTSNPSVSRQIFSVTITNAGGATVGTGEVRFDDNGRLLAGYTTVNATLQAGGASQTIAFDFGAAGGGPNEAMTSFSGNASLQANVTDGHGVLGLRELKFTDKGVMEFIYSDSQKRTGPQIALASFPNDSGRTLASGRLIAGVVASARDIGRPGEVGFGSIVGRSLELSNVDLTQEFADMIIIQRGYQASSRVMSVGNEMLEQLYNSTRGG